MPRQPRKPSSTGIFHVMMRGINHQEIFCDAEDYYQFINTLDRMRVQYDDDGNPCGTNCTYYAYCLMSNHFHLLIREREEPVGDTIKRIASSYVYYFNRKYGRDGHLFKERFKSEPVNDMAYFTTLLRYIHQNPVKAGIVEHVKDYEYSSWSEYDGSVDSVFQICNTQTVLNRIPFTELEAWANEPLPEDVYCLDIEGSSRRRPSDDQIWKLIIEKTGVTNNSAFQQLDNNTKQQVFLELKDCGASLRQLERLTGIGKGVIHRIWNSGKL
ncbi:transposase [Prevotella communis]|uniref:transposase n=1 Tax=Prevotella communis TaxID=2913614 RepID=UPI001EDBCC7B|nr:transposase [Prevotella communis]UKK56925.1 transposase [Prevotella communis]